MQKNNLKEAWLCLMGVSYSTKMAEDWSLDMREELRSVLYSPDVEAAMQEVRGSH